MSIFRNRDFFNIPLTGGCFGPEIAITTADFVKVKYIKYLKISFVYVINLKISLTVGLCLIWFFVTRHNETWHRSHNLGNLQLIKSNKPYLSKAIILLLFCFFTTLLTRKYHKMEAYHRHSDLSSTVLPRDLTTIGFEVICFDQGAITLVRILNVNFYFVQYFVYWSLYWTYATWMIRLILGTP